MVLPFFALPAMGLSSDTDDCGGAEQLETAAPVREGRSLGGARQVDAGVSNAAALTPPTCLWSFACRGDSPVRAASGRPALHSSPTVVVPRPARRARASGGWAATVPLALTRHAPVGLSAALGVPWRACGCFP